MIGHDVGLNMVEKARHRRVSTYPSSHCKDITFSWYSFSNLRKARNATCKAVSLNLPSMLRRNFLVTVPMILVATHLYVPESAGVTFVTTSLQVSGSSMISRWELDTMGSSSLNQAIAGAGRRPV